MYILLWSRKQNSLHVTFTECPTFGQYLVRIFDRVAISRGRSPRILGGPPKFLRSGGPETPFHAALSDKYFCQNRFGKLIVISRLFSRLVFTAGSKCMGGVFSSKFHFTSSDPSQVFRFLVYLTKITFWASKSGF